MPPIFRETGVIGELPNTPTTLGVASHAMGDARYPDVELEAVSGGFKFKSTEANYDVANPTVTLLKSGKYNVGLSTVELKKGVIPASFIYNSQLGMSRMITVNVKALTVSPALTADRKVTAQFQLNLDRSAFEAVKTKEQEHLDDFKAAFTMTGQAVANKINSLTAVYKTRELAMKALLEGLERRLVPKYPLDLPSWKPRLQRVALELADLSIERDTKFEHSPDGYDCSISLSAMP